ncbi:ABC-2 type transport system ATP-binding protein [Breznakibacter xylanolyticus]|uniref:ABC-2 type transport system ATP-binding protein n=1 Tax=Breznakibacter xylanolyticus TaxID=990 RepID=A0A2W7NHE0_9BACT|nr:ATP-binding cassette domain-containing protein [Breznakibacter xylanolyticus]PZX16094.1 ABC-2 type transport system ATP-binding protein [Breznakibacter xylanolyticus]
MDFLEIAQVTKQYGSYKALDSVSITVCENQIYGLLGPNGAGKTTLIRIINQITRPDMGEVRLQGKPMTRDDISLVGYLPEERGLYKKMKVGEQALYLAQLKGMSRRDALRELKFWFEKFEIQPWWDKKVEELSKGMQQKVQFVTTVLHRPRLLIFDEPFSGFDPINANLLKNEIQELKHQGATILFSTHHMASVEELCDDIALMNRSQVILSGGVDEIRRQYQSGRMRLTYSGDVDLASVLPLGCSLLSDAPSRQLRVAEIQSANGLDVNAMLRVLLPVMSIHGVHEVLPSMNEIFIRLVKQSGE